ncbi:hypothetical protein H6G54_25315 [Anabaena cylindrica FACHB-243]|uniref:Uncharacterized protein n=1 Tax=Anabaena cylindrica (strain ATCC 27899 / PCC 7122) TaxID=272123 RepID=K9ZFE0_ANACC|nr:MULTISPECIES: hypothetical protein [Anabaena]AFZ57287.1 hypothetical protein Anacy_1797 [Anabaena cylindrica PCC 7122]MBD2420956.1 hypothetical protein [Anabaena cylindrica FACHB-243]MBY5283443.1 hypothetical protein [Anabaena sp. CCAP 1446/1C]MBY5310889.1 hypothetical protein [Anabaena sp. CCAP 1446/1C]MCM2405709.1 hypothetical protein [Anabaena sp. CCAP 1446/1C]
MLELSWFSIKLFFKGKLLRDPINFLGQIIIASTIGTLILVLLAQAEIPLCIPITVSSLITGIITPFLLKDFKMK